MFAWGHKLVNGRYRSSHIWWVSYYFFNMVRNDQNICSVIAFRLSTIFILSLVFTDLLGCTPKSTGLCCLIILIGKNKKHKMATIDREDTHALHCVEHFLKFYFIFNWQNTCTNLWGWCVFWFMYILCNDQISVSSMSIISNFSQIGHIQNPRF